MNTKILQLVLCIYNFKYDWALNKYFTLPTKELYQIVVQNFEFLSFKAISVLLSKGIFTKRLIVYFPLMLFCAILSNIF